MRFKFLRLFLLTGMVFSISGCASFLTMMSPVHSEIVVAEKSAGDFNKYAYRYQIRSGQMMLSKTPMCTETASAYRKSGKRVIGYGPAILEMSFFGLGLVDILNAHAIADYSKKEYPLAEYETGKLLSCGRPVPAAGETVIMENKARNIQRKGLTDANGALNLNAVLQDVGGAAQFTVYLESDPDVRFAYLYAGPKLAVKTTAQPNTYNN